MEFLAANPMLLLVVFLLFMLFLGMRKNMKIQQQMQEQMVEHQRRLREEVEPGTWVVTSSGFYGRFVDVDGATVILEAPHGGETYWDVAAIPVGSIGVSPFPEAEGGEGSPALEEAEEGEDKILGLDSGDTHKPEASA